MEFEVFAGSLPVDQEGNPFCGLGAGFRSPRKLTIRQPRSSLIPWNFWRLTLLFRGTSAGIG